MSEDKKTEKEPRVKIEILRPCLINRHRDKNDVLQGTIVETGIHEVVEAEAKELCDTQFRGHFSFGGERQWAYDADRKLTLDPAGHADATKTHDYRRARRVA